MILDSVFGAATPCNPGNQLYLDPVWSPDGTKIADAVTLTTLTWI